MPDLTPELLCDLWQPDGVSLSGDGGRVAWSASPAGRRGTSPESGIWVARVGAPDSARRWTWWGRDHSPVWSPDGRSLAFLSTRGESGKAGIHVMSAEGGEARPWVCRARDVAAFAWSPDGGRIAYVAPEDPSDEDERRDKERDDPDVRGERWHPHRLYVAEATELPDGSATDATDAPAPEPIADLDRHVAALAWSPEGDRIAVTTWPTPELDDSREASIEVVDVASSRRRTVTAGYGPRDLTWTRDGRRLAWLSTVDQQPQGSFTLWSTEVDGGGAAIAGPGSDGDRCVSGVTQGRAADEVLITVAHGLRSLLVPIRLDSGEASDALGDIVGTFETARLAPDGTLAVVRHSEGLPGRVAAGRRSDLRVHSDHHAILDEVDLPVVEPFAAIAADGTELDAVLIRSREVAAGGPAKMLVLPHGGPYGRSSLEWETHPVRPAQLLAARGYAVLLPNYRGGAGRGHGFASAARGDMGGDEWADVLALVDAAVDAQIADPDRLGLGGWSQGGFLTAWGSPTAIASAPEWSAPGRPTGTRWRSPATCLPSSPSSADRRPGTVPAPTWPWPGHRSPMQRTATPRSSCSTARTTPASRPRRRSASSARSGHTVPPPRWSPTHGKGTSSRNGDTSST